MSESFHIALAKWLMRTTNLRDMDEVVDVLTFGYLIAITAVRHPEWVQALSAQLSTKDTDEEVRIRLSDDIVKSVPMEMI